MPGFRAAAPVGLGASPIPKRSGHDSSYGAAVGAWKQLFAQFVEVIGLCYFGGTQSRMSQAWCGFRYFFCPAYFTARIDVTGQNSLEPSASVQRAPAGPDRFFC